MKQRLVVLYCCVFWAFAAEAATMNFSGAMRLRVSGFNNLGLGVANLEKTKSYVSSRFLLNPALVIDDHFSVKSQWSLLTSPVFSPDATLPLGWGQGDFVWGDVESKSLILSRAWVEWMSDFGVLRAGRMPVSWGYGLIWDAGTGTWDDWQTTLDRLEYRLHLGRVVGGLAYSKSRKRDTRANLNDQEFYTIYLQYNNQEMEVEAGILYEKQSRATAQGTDYLTYVVPEANPYRRPEDTGSKMGYPMSDNVVDVYLKKTVGYFTFGGELAWVTGTATDYNGSGPATVNTAGVIANAVYDYHKFKAFVEGVYAQGDSQLDSNHMNGFVLLNRNRSPGLMLGRELLGNYFGKYIGMGSHALYGNKDSFSGVFYVRPGARYDWTPSLSSGVEVIVSQKAAAQTGEESFLGIEVDLGTEYSVYKNFDIGANVGFLMPGAGLGVTSPQTAFAIQAVASIKF